MVYPLSRKRTKRKIGSWETDARPARGGIEAVTGGGPDNRFIIIAAGVVAAVAVFIAAQLASISGDYERIVLAPRPTLPENEIALTAWGRILRLDTVDEDRIREFVNVFQGVDHQGAG